MQACYNRHRALAFGGRKSGSDIKVGTVSEEDNPLKNIINNVDHQSEEHYISKDVITKLIKIGNKIQIPTTEEDDADDIDAFNQYAVGILN